MATRRSRFGWLVAFSVQALVFGWGRPAHAESGSALSRLAQRVSTVSPTTPAFAAVTPLAGANLSAEDRAALDGKLAKVLGSAVTGSRARGEAAMDETTARLRARQLGLSLVLVEPALKDGQLVVDVDVIEWELSFWARSRKPLGTVVTHASFNEPADTEIRRYLPRPKQLLTSELRFTAPERGSIALGCGDARGFGTSELLVVSRRNLFLGTLLRKAGTPRGAFITRRSATWESLSPLSPHPLRAPLAGAWLQPGTVLVGSSDRAALVGLDAELQAAQFAEPAIPVTPERCHAITATGVATSSSSCRPLAKTPPVAAAAATDAPSHDAIAYLAHTDEHGIVKSYELVSSAGGKLTLTIDSPLEERRVHELPKGGAQVALADLDGDSIVEAITTVPTEAGSDALQIHALTATGPVLVATRAIGPVRGLAVCPFEGQNPQRLAVLLDDEIRIFE